MQHRIKGRKLNRTASHRKALIRNLANQLIEHKEIKTTTAKAKETRITVERLITYAKKGDTHHRRLAFGFLRKKDTIKTLFDEIAPAYTERQGGYTRVLKLGQRQGDGAPMAILQLVDFEALSDSSKPEKKKRRRKKEERSSKKDVKDAGNKDENIEETPVQNPVETEEKLNSEVEDLDTDQAEIKAADKDANPEESEPEKDKSEK